MNYYIYVNNEQQGPYTVDELRSRNITQETLVWCEGMARWTPAWQVDELRTLFEAAPQPGQATPPPVTPSPVQPQEEPLQAQQGKSGAGCGTVSLIAAAIVALILLGLSMTCPDRQDHEEAVSNEINTFINQSADNPSDGWEAIGRMFASGIAEMAVSQMLDYHNYVLWSVGEVHYAGKTKTVSFGILGHVFTFDADDLQRALDGMKGNTDQQEATEPDTDTTVPDIPEPAPEPAQVDTTSF